LWSYLLVCAAVSDLYLKQTIRIVCELITVKNHHRFWKTTHQILYSFKIRKQLINLRRMCSI